MREIAETLERSIREVKYGAVSVELRIHDGEVVKTIYRTSKTNVKRSAQEKQEQSRG
jgi:hypothetical protein